MNVVSSVLNRLGGGPATATLRQADVARDGKQWHEAASLYREYLGENPGNGDIWVQFGHAAKEGDDLAGAEVAYRQAASLLPQDPDPLLHLAHLLKRVGKPDEAAGTFKRLFALSPTQEVMAELTALGRGIDAVEMGVQAAASSTATGWFLELEDVLQYLEHHSTVTGISRVVLSLAHYVLNEMPQAQAERIHFVYHLLDKDELFLISKPLIQRLVSSALSARPDGAELNALAIEARRVASPIGLGAGDLYFVPGAFWMAGENSNFLPKLRRRGVRLGAYIYDLIPITHAHYCEASLTEVFTVAFAETTPFFDFVLTISAFVADQVTTFLHRHHLPALPAIPVPLAHEFGLRPSTPGTIPPVAEAAEVEVLDGRRFVLCVCTIEARKNHTYLLTIWQRLIEEGLDAPDLVFVGRIGWRVTDLMSQIQASRNLDGKLHVLHGISDATLSALYDQCLFTAFPSFVEGWGLPAGESLAHGKVCVASSTTSLPEVGGELNLYIDPFNLASGHDLIRRLITDSTFLAERETLIRDRFVSRTWTDVGRQFFEEMARCLAAAPALQPGRLPAPRIEPGELLSTRQLQLTLKRRAAYVENPLRLLFAEGWRVIEATGTWVNKAAATLRFRSPYEAGRVVTVLLRLSSSPWISDRNVLRIDAAAQPGGSQTAAYSQALRPSTFFWSRLQGQVGPDGVIAVRFTVSGAINAAADAIPVAIRLHAVGYYATDDIPARLDLLENIFMFED